MSKKYNLINFCEFDKFAAQAYCAVHNVDRAKNLGDINEVDETKIDDFNMICGGSPCQDFSCSGKLKGSIWTCKDCGAEYNPLTVHYTQRGCCPNCLGANIHKTRSSLLIEYLRIVRANKPAFGIYENVKNIAGKRFTDTFKMFTHELEEYGYNIYYKVLNAKHYGIPQNRERVYVVFIRQDLDNGLFKFPDPVPLKNHLEDLLLDKVDERYYITSRLNDVIEQCEPLPDRTVFEKRTDEGVRLFKDDMVGTLRTIDACGDKCVLEKEDDIRIRKLTPKECWRLMGFSDQDYEKAEAAGISVSQLYKQAGNSIVVDVLYYIYKELYIAMPYLFEDLKLLSLFSGIGAFEKALEKLYQDINDGVNFNNPPVACEAGGEEYQQVRYKLTNKDGFFNAIRQNTIKKSYLNLYNKRGYIPRFLNLYDFLEIKNGIHCTLTTASHRSLGTGTVLFIEDKSKK